jgi:hypothetical protein
MKNQMTETNKQTALDIIEINGVKYQRINEPKPEPETLTLKNLLKKWEFDFSGKWVKNMITSELYEEEVERFLKMFEEWLPDAIGDVQDDWDDGYNSYRYALMEKLK